MTYGEIFLIWFRRILLILLALCLIGIVTSTVVKSRQAVNRSDAVISRADYLLNKYGR